MLAVDVMEHFENDVKVFENFHRAMKKGGMLIISTPSNLAKAFACKTAIKAGYKLTLEEIQVLIDQLFLTRHPYVCPHGRPIIIKISIEELDKRFGRT